MMRFISLATMALATAHAFVVLPQSSTVPSTQLFADTVAEETTAAATTTDDAAPPKSLSPMFEYLKFDGQPTFDVLAKTQEYIETFQSREPGTYEDLYDEQYVLRGPVIGPINRADLDLSQNGLGIRDAFDTKIETFGYTVDPENPYRCFYFQRWRAVMEKDMDAYGQVYPATKQQAEMPVSVFSVVWTPEGKIIYEQVGAVVDRFEGNTQGKAAVFGLLHHAGIKISASPGDGVFSFVQRLGHVLGGRGRSWSRQVDVPKWWVSKSRGADSTDEEW